jgi:hypothetical protein
MGVPNPPFTHHLTVLRERLARIDQLIEDTPDLPHGYKRDERKALQWALTIIEGELASEKDIGQLRDYYSKRAKVINGLEKEFKLFLEFLGFLEWYRTEEKVKLLHFDY